MKTKFDKMYEYEGDIIPFKLGAENEYDITEDLKRDIIKINKFLVDEFITLSKDSNFKELPNNIGFSKIYIKTDFVKEICNLKTKVFEIASNHIDDIIGKNKKYTLEELVKIEYPESIKSNYLSIVVDSIMYELDNNIEYFSNTLYIVKNMSDFIDFMEARNYISLFLQLTDVFDKLEHIQLRFIITEEEMKKDSNESEVLFQFNQTLPPVVVLGEEVVRRAENSLELEEFTNEFIQLIIACILFKYDLDYDANKELIDGRYRI